MMTQHERQELIAWEIETALAKHYEAHRIDHDGRFFVSPEGQMSWRDPSGRQVVVTVQVAQP